MASLRVAMRLSLYDISASPPVPLTKRPPFALPSSSGPTVATLPLKRQPELVLSSSVSEPADEPKKAKKFARNVNGPTASIIHISSLADRSAKAGLAQIRARNTENLPATRFPRRASCRNTTAAATTEASLRLCADTIRQGKRVVVITGAGLSCASGIPPFRASRQKPEDASAVWSKNVICMGTKRAFLEDPRNWWESFWLPSFAPARMRRMPNAGHDALARIASLARSVALVTQNVDGLAQRSAYWGPSLDIIEAHGRVGLYKCSS